MKHNREFWMRHVKAWRASGLTQRQYCRRHGLVKGTLAYWASKLNKSKATGSALVEVGKVPAQAEKQRSPIELMVQRRYLLRLWPGTERDHLRDVLSVLEPRS